MLQGGGNIALWSSLMAIGARQRPATGTEKPEVAKAIQAYTSKYIPKDSSAALTFTSGTPAGTEGYTEVIPDAGYDALAIKYFRLTTPLEVKGNILLTGLAGEETKMLAEDQAENTTTVYDAADFDQFFWLLKEFRLYGITSAETSAVREVKVEMGGKQVKL